MTAFELQRESAALLVVDMQKGFIDKGATMEVAPARKIIPNIKRLLGEFRELKVPVIFTRFVYSTNLPNLIGELHEQHKPPIGCCLLGTESAAIVTDLTPNEEELIIDKHGYDAFYNTRLDYALRSLKCDQLIITGVMTDICVLATVSSALHHEYKIWVVSDATATIWEHVQEVSLDLFRRAYGMVNTTEEILRSLNRIY